MKEFLKIVTEIALLGIAIILVVGILAMASNSEFKSDFKTGCEMNHGKVVNDKCIK